MRFAFIAKHRGIWPVAWMCGALGVSRSGFHAWLSRAPSQRARDDDEIGAKVRASHVGSYRTYGARRVWHDLLAEGICCGLHRVERLMRAQGLRARPRRRGLPEDQGERSVIAGNVLDRQFTADRPNQKWVADFTYIWTAEGWLYVAAVIDLFSRRMVGWSMSDTMTAQLVTDALIMAIWRRGKPDALLHHSDQGSQGGLNRSSQHFNEGGCDGHSEAAFRSMWAVAITVTWSTARVHSERAAAVLGVDRDGDEQRGSWAQGWRIATFRTQMVPGGGRHATSDVQVHSEAAVGKISSVGRAGGDRAAARPGS
jgi:putative transposase